MSQNSFSRMRRLPGWAVRTTATVAATIGYTVWTVGSVFFLGALLVGELLRAVLGQLGITASLSESVILQSTASVLVYMIGLGLLLVEPYAIRRLTTESVRVLFGVMRQPAVRDLGIAFLAWAAYIVLSLVISVIGSLVLSGVDMTQAQHIGFEQRSTGLDIVLAFCTIVIAAPLVEEVIFRGYLFGSVRTHMPWWLGAVIVSVVFGIVHGQWNVGLDVFAMSMVCCFLRERTGAIWAGVYLHMVKNFLAFSVLFLLPEQVRQLLMNL